MRILASLIFLIFLCDHIHSQNVTLDDLIRLRSKSINEIEELLPLKIGN